MSEVEGASILPVCLFSGYGFFSMCPKVLCHFSIGLLLRFLGIVCTFQMPSIYQTSPTALSANFLAS